MSRPGDPRSTYAWQQLRLQVIREEPLCTLRLPGCTTYSTTADHIVAVALRPDLALERSNCRGACAHCNYARGGAESRRAALSEPASRDW